MISVLNFLFWNINRKPILERLKRIVKCYNIDVIMLAESALDSNEIVSEFDRIGLNGYKVIGSTRFFAGGEVYLHTIVNFQCTVSPFPSRRWHLLAIDRPNHAQFILGNAHMPSKLECNHILDSMNTARDLSRDIELKESDHGHSRLILAGDLNRDYFDESIVAHSGLHAIAPEVAKAKSGRTVNRTKKKYFCNPFWSKRINSFSGVNGTYYYDASGKEVNYFWHTYDQVLFRPSLSDSFAGLDVLCGDCIGSKNLLTQGGLPDIQFASDHLPIYFTFNI